MGFKCVKCQSEFSRYASLWRHISTIHGSSKQQLECFHCSRKFSRRDGLIRHLFSKHIDGNVYRCNLCSITFGSYSKFLYHQNKFHLEKKLVECYYCGKKFPRKCGLKRHILSQHMTVRDKIVSFTFTCVLCCETFSKRNTILDHFKLQHLLDFETENHRFENEDAFNSWRTAVEKQCYTSYRLQYSSKRNGRIRKVYVCNRSGFYLPNVSPEQRKRRLKIQGSKMINGFCPSEIIFQIDGSGVNVKFLKSHVGHQCDVNQITHMRFSSEEKNCIINKVSSGTPTTKIIQDMTAGDVSVTEKIHLLSKKDIWNIAASRRLILNHSRREIQNDVLDVQAWVQKNNDSVLFYKRQGEEDVSYFNLNVNDFVLVIMTKEQISVFQNYASKGVIVDGTHGNNKRLAGFFLHSVLVMDYADEGYGCCFMISNRNDQTAISTMFTCIRDKIGVVQSEIFMSELQLSYINAWETVMGYKPKFHLICVWHVIRMWQQNLPKVPILKRKELKTCLLGLIHQQDIYAFHQQFEEFLRRKDEELQPFIKYFTRIFGKNYESWADCYKINAGFNINMSIDHFHNTFKYIHGARLTIQQVHDTLHVLDTYLKTKHLDELNHKVSCSRSNHDAAKFHLTTPDNALQKIKNVSKNSWLVPSFTSTYSTYTVKKVTKTCEPTCCMICSDCHFCSHQFTCTCSENSVKNIMCKHIHGLCLTNMLDLIEVNENVNYLIFDSENYMFWDQEKQSNEEVIPITVERLASPKNNCQFSIRDEKFQTEITDLTNSYTNLIKEANEKQLQYLRNHFKHLSSVLSTMQ